MRRRRGEKVLRPVRPSAAIESAYKRRIEALVDEMARSYYRWLRAAYRANPPEMAADATPARELDRELKLLGRRWRRRFDSAAPKMAAYFATSVEKRSDAVMAKILRDAGISVRMQMTPAMKDIAQATVAENVSLIKSIPAHFHLEVEGLVMRSVTVGRDLSELTKELQHRFGVTRRRAEFIASDQNNKATAAFTRARQQENGIDEAVWLHSHAGKTPRRTHLANDGHRSKISEGWFDPDPRVQRKIWPGALPRCRCLSKSIVKGFS